MNQSESNFILNFVDLSHTLKFRKALLWFEVDDPPDASESLSRVSPPAGAVPPVEGRKLLRDADFLCGLLAVKVRHEDLVVEAGHVRYKFFSLF